MTWLDLFWAPVYIILAAVFFRGRRNKQPKLIRRYFLPALAARFVGAVALGLIYQFYYKGGDTFLYHALSAQMNDGPIGHTLRVVFGSMSSIHTYPELQYYVHSNGFYEKGDEATFFLLRIIALIGEFTFNIYTITALAFATFSFIGSWSVFLVFCDLYPRQYKTLAFSVLYVPSVVFWGSGLMKDTITFGAIGITFYGFYFGVLRRQNILPNILSGLFGLFLVFSIKAYILYCFLPAVALWLYLHYSKQIKSVALRALVAPFLLLFSTVFGYYAVRKLSETSNYTFDNIAQKTNVTYTYLRQMTAEKGSAYEIGPYDGSLTGLFRYFPQGVTVSLFRPFLWEVRNPVALLAALEALLFAFFTLRLLLRVPPWRLLALLQREPVILVSLTFAITFSFAVGISSGNFGTLVRYKIPMMPFYLSAVLIAWELGKPQPKTRPLVAA